MICKDCFGEGFVRVVEDGKDFLHSCYQCSETGFLPDDFYRFQEIDYLVDFLADQLTIQDSAEYSQERFFDYQSAVSSQVFNLDKTDPNKVNVLLAWFNQMNEDWKNRSISVSEKSQVQFKRICFEDFDWGEFDQENQSIPF